LNALHRAVAALLRETAEAVILPRYQQLEAHQVEEKSPGDLVTIADKESEALLSAGLARLLPEAAIIGEEACAADPALLGTLDQQLAWIIDPIDGTHNFANGQPWFAVMIGLVDGGEIQSGWIWDPLRQRLCSAHRGQGAFINDDQVHARPTGITPPVAAISTRFIAEPERSQIEQRIAGKLTPAEIPLCAGEQYPRIVLGENDIALFHRTLPWDHVAGVLFLEEAGGKAARLDGSPYRYWDGGTGLLAAVNEGIWEEAAGVIAG
jgi:fructose-1,6-bisphosphatase/inositol monophosphatase family enzyme